MSAQEGALGLFKLCDRCVDIWPFGLSAPDPVITVFQKLLDSEEATRASRFHFEHLRRSFVIAHGALRLLLGHYLSVDASDIRFSMGQRGKPRLDPAGRLRFNLSHSGAVAILALTLDCEIGVDVEKVHPMEDMSGIATRFFCREEAAELMSLAPSEQHSAFFRCWTRKEAYVKAIGDGLHAPLDRFRVSIRPDVAARLIQIEESTTAAEAWTLHDIDAVQHYSAALAYKDAPRQVRVRPFFSPADLQNMLSQSSGTHCPDPKTVVESGFSTPIED